MSRSLLPLSVRHAPIIPFARLLSTLGHSCSSYSTSTHSLEHPEHAAGQVPLAAYQRLITAHYNTIDRLNAEQRKEIHCLHAEQRKEVERLNAERRKEVERLNAEQRKEFERLNAEKCNENYRFYEEKVAAAIQIERLRAAALTTMEEKLRLQHNFNVHGALERIVYKASLDQIISNHGGVQLKLDRLAQLPDFKAIVQQEVADRKLVLGDVISCAKRLYHELSKHAHGNDGTVTVREADYTPPEYAALISYLKLQDRWSDAMPWKEEKIQEQNGDK